MSKWLKLIKRILIERGDWYCPQCDALNMGGRWNCGNCGYIDIN